MASPRTPSKPSAGIACRPSRATPSAEYALGEAHEHGEGAPRDLRAARRWYQAAADQDNTDAQEALQRLTVNPE